MLSLPFALRFLLVTHPGALTQVLGIVYRTISAHSMANRVCGTVRTPKSTAIPGLLLRVFSMLWGCAYGHCPGQ